MSDEKEVGQLFEGESGEGRDVIVLMSVDEEEDKLCISIDGDGWALWIPMERVRKLSGGAK